jgi:hypothetical protein
VLLSSVSHLQLLQAQLEHLVPAMQLCLLLVAGVCLPGSVPHGAAAASANTSCSNSTSSYGAGPATTAATAAAVAVSM